MTRDAGILLILLLAAAMLCAGCTSAPPPDTTPVATPTPQIIYVTVTATPLPTSPTIAPTSPVTSTITDTLQPVEDPVLGNWENSSDSGIYRVDFRVGGEFFQSTRLSGEGETHAFGIWQTLGNNRYSTTIGTSSSSWTYNPATGCLVMDTEPDAPYTKDSMTPQSSPVISTPETTPQLTPIEQSVNTELTEGTGGSAGNYFSGSDDGEVNFTVSAPSMTLFQMSYSGNSNFTVWLEDSGGYQLGMLAGVTGPYSGESSFRLNPGLYYLEIKTTGPWTISATGE